VVSKFILIDLMSIWHCIFSESLYGRAKPNCHRTDHSLKDPFTVITWFWHNVQLLSFAFAEQYISERQRHIFRANHTCVDLTYLMNTNAEDIIGCVFDEGLSQRVPEI